MGSECSREMLRMCKDQSATKATTSSQRTLRTIRTPIKDTKDGTLPLSLIGVLKALWLLVGPDSLYQ